MSLSLLSLLHVSVLAVLVVFSTPFNTSKSALIARDVCVTRDLSNPLAETFPNNATGVLNGTLAIVSIPLETARRLIPPHYGILEQAYRSIMPDFPEGMYPVFVQAAHDHDIQLRAFGITIDDFSRAGFEFPFLDFLNDGYSSFRWAPAQLITAENMIAVRGSEAYGTKVYPAKFEPLCDAYKNLPNGATYFRGTSTDSKTFMEVEFTRIRYARNVPYSVDVFKNITNQPIFVNGSTCDSMIRLFNTSLSTGSYEPVPVRGRVRANAAPWDAEEEWTGVFGFQITTPFIENNYLDCRTLQGYTGTGGPGDSYSGNPPSVNSEL